MLVVSNLPCRVAHGAAVPAALPARHLPVAFGNTEGGPHTAASRVQSLRSPRR